MRTHTPHVYWLVLFFLLILQLESTAQKATINAYRFGEGITFTGKDGYEMELRGYAQPTIELKNYTDSNDNALYSRVRMRRLRIRLSGESKKYKVSYRFQTDLSGNSEAGDSINNFLLDAWVGYNPTRNITIKFGQQATPTDNRELTIGSQTLQLVERSVLTSAFASIREFGIFADGTFKTGFGSYVKSYLCITNGDGQNAFNADFGGLKYGGRIDFLPFGLFSFYGQYREGDVIRENSPKLVIGAIYSYNQGMSSRRGRESGSILYLNDSGQVALPSYTKIGFDFMFKYRGFSMLGEFNKTAATVPTEITQRVRVDGTTSTVFDVNGVQDVENYIKGRMMLGSGYNIQAGYIFKNRFSVDARYTHMKADQYSFLNNGTFYNRPNYYTLGITQYLSKGYGFKVQASATYVEASAGSNNIYGLPITGNEWIFRMGTTISF